MNSLLSEYTWYIDRIPYGWFYQASEHYDGHSVYIDIQVIVAETL